MKEQIKELLPEIELIKDSSLREKTIDVWARAMEIGGWTKETVTKVPFTLLIQDCKVDLVSHTRAVTLTSIRSAEVMQKMYGDGFVNMDYLIAGAILHDVGKLLEYSVVNGKFVKSNCGKLLRHPFSGMALVYQFGLPDEVTHIVAVHAHEGDGGKRIREAIIVNHADFMNFEALKEQ